MTFLAPKGLPGGTAPRLAIPARLTWKDASGATRVASVLARHVDAGGVTVECETAAAIPLYRLVHLQIERSATGTEALPPGWREGRLLSAVWQVGPCRRSTGTPSGYALRVLASPGTERHVPPRPLAVAS
ncbi:MAG: hypothetical protein AB7H88_19730 [Vicinamibacterales bacterium]